MGKDVVVEWDQKPVPMIFEDRCELQIVCVPEGDSYGPRLVYEVKKGYNGLVIDACSGRVLYRTSYDW